MTSIWFLIASEYLFQVLVGYYSAGRCYRIPLCTWLNELKREDEAGSPRHLNGAKEGWTQSMLAVAFTRYIAMAASPLW